MVNFGIAFVAYMLLTCSSIIL